MIVPAPQLWPDGASIDARGHLVIGGCDTVELARAYGTPLYLLDEATFRASCRAYGAALARHYPGASGAHYASKALLNSAVAKLVAGRRRRMVQAKWRGLIKRMALEQAPEFVWRRAKAANPGHGAVAAAASRSTERPDPSLWA